MALIYQNIKLIYYLTFLQNHSLLNLPEFRCHQLIQLRIAGELVDERHEGAAYFQKPLSCPHIGDIAHLQVGDVKELCKLNPICGRLVEHEDRKSTRLNSSHS